MHKNLGWIAAAGFAVAAIFLAGAWLVSGKMGPADIALRLSGFALPVCREDGAGGMASRDIAWDGANRMGIGIPATVRYRPGSGDRLKVTGDAALVSHIRVENGDIKLDCRPAGGKTPPLDITLPGSSFRSFSLAGVTRLILSDIDQPELHLNIAGSSSVSGTGKVERLTINGAGLSDAKLGELPVKQAELNLAGSSSIEIAPEDTLTVNSVGATTVVLRAEPRNVRTNIVGSGRIIHQAL